MRARLVARPSMMSAAQTYDAVHLLLRAMFDSKGDLSSAGLKKALENPRNTYRGVVTTYERAFSPQDHDAISANMLVMGKDHKIYYEAYNDASDLDGDGALDIGYKPGSITYYGYFNSNACYEWKSGNNRFEPSGPATNKQCSGAWSGDFLTYVTTSRMDALRRVL